MLTAAQCDAVILAGGKASRLQPVVSDRPKILADIGGQPFAHYLLDQLFRSGFRRAVICVGHLADMVEDALGARWGGLDIAYSREESPLDTGGAIGLALPLLGGSHGVIINGDTFAGIDHNDMLACFERSGAEAALAVVKVPDPGRYGTVTVGPTGLVEGFIEKSAVSAGGGDAPINAGVYVLSRRQIEAIAPGQKISVERELMPQWVRQGLYAYRSEGPFIDIGTPSSYAEAQSRLAEWTRSKPC